LYSPFLDIQFHEIPFFSRRKRNSLKITFLVFQVINSELVKEEGNCMRTLTRIDVHFREGRKESTGDQLIATALFLQFCHGT